MATNKKEDADWAPCGASIVIDRTAIVRIKRIDLIALVNAAGGVRVNGKRRNVPTTSRVDLTLGDAKSEMIGDDNITIRWTE